MALQELLVGIIVIAALLYIARKFIVRYQGATSAKPGCGCCCDDKAKR